MTALTSGSGVVYINGRSYSLGLLEMRPFGSTGDDVIIVYAEDGYVFSGRMPFSSFTIDGGAPADRDELLAWAAQYFSLCGGAGFNAAPVASSVTISGTAQVGQTLTGSYNYSDAESDPQGTSLKQWYRADSSGGSGRAAISGATGSTYVVQSGDLGKFLQFSVTPKATSGTLTGAVASSTYTSAVTSGGGGGGGNGYFLQKDNNTNPTEGEILAGTSFSITAGANYTVAIPDIGSKFIMVFEPSSEPQKTKVNDTLGDADINGENAFGEIVTIGAFRGYKTNYLTAFDTALTFKIS